jgi:galactokinase
MQKCRTLGQWNHGSFSSVMGLKQSYKIDCKTLEYEYHNADFNDYSLILFDSM